MVDIARLDESWFPFDCLCGETYLDARELMDHLLGEGENPATRAGFRERHRGPRLPGL